MPLKAFVVEDNVSIRESLVEALAELAGIATSGVAGSEKAAIAWLTNADNEWDVAIVDLILEPGGSGFGVLNALRNRKPGQKMVVLTGTANAAGAPAVPGARKRRRLRQVHRNGRAHGLLRFAGAVRRPVTRGPGADWKAAVPRRPRSHAKIGPKRR